MEDKIKQSLQALSEEQAPINKQTHMKYHKSNSFSEFSDWSNKHHYINQSIYLPRINDNSALALYLQNYHPSPQPHPTSLPPPPQRYIQSQLSTPKKKSLPLPHNFPSGQSCQLKPIQIQFKQSQNLRGFQKSFYQNYLKQRLERKGSRITPGQFLSIQQQIDIKAHRIAMGKAKGKGKEIGKVRISLEKYIGVQVQIQKEKLVKLEAIRYAVGNRGMNRKNRLRRQHFFDEFLVTNQYGKETNKN